MHRNDIFVVFIVAKVFIVATTTIGNNCSWLLQSLFLKVFKSLFSNPVGSIIMMVDENFHKFYLTESLLPNNNRLYKTSNQVFSNVMQNNDFVVIFFAETKET